MTTCNCAAAGYCDTFRKTQSERHWQICRNEVLTPEKCEVYRQNWLKLANTQPGQPNRADCIHRGQQTRLGTCDTCQGNVQIKVFACPVHGECAIGEKIAGAACCATCQQFELTPVAG